MTVLEKAVMLAGQFSLVLLQTPAVQPGTIVIQEDGVYIHPEDGD